MLERLAFTATFYQIAQRRKFCFSQLPFEFEIKLDTSLIQNMRQQVLGIQSRILNIALVEIGSRRLQHFENRHRHSERNRGIPLSYRKLSNTGSFDVAGLAQMTDA